MTPPRTATSPRRPVPAPERARHLEVVRGAPVPGRRPPAKFLVLAAALMCAALLTLVVANVILGQAGFTHADLQARVTQKRQTVEQLELDKARLRAPARIAARATELGMVPAPDVTIIVADESGRGGLSPLREGR